MKRIVLGIMLMLLAVFLSTTIVEVNSAAGASIVISPDTLTIPPNTSFVLNLTINNVDGMRAWSVTLVYQRIITLTWVDTMNNTDFTDGAGLSIFKQEDYNSSCYMSDVARTTVDIAPRSGTGSGLVAQLFFLAVSNGVTTIDCIDYEMMNSSSRNNEITPITVARPLATITVATPQPRSVGGTSFSLAKAAFPAPYIGLASAIIAVVAIIATTIYFKAIKHRKEKQ